MYIKLISLVQMTSTEVTLQQSYKKGAEKRCELTLDFYICKMS